MKLSSVLTAIGGGAAPVVNTASALAILFGGIYLVDCRLSAHSSEAVDRCYFTALPLMGIGAAGRGGFQAGFQTYNPALRPPDGQGQQRDAHGRFSRRED